jgi:hypothetical protein
LIPQIAWIIPLIIPFIIGLLVGVIIKQSIKLIFSVAALVAILVFTGYISLTFQDVLNQALNYLPAIIKIGTRIMDLLLYATTTFLIGLALGLWKG